MIGIIGAMDIEVSMLKNNMKDARTVTVSGIDFITGKLFDHDAVVAKCGVGKVNAALCTEAMILKFSPDMIINTGIAGSLSEKLSLLDVAVARSVVLHDFDISYFGYPRGLVPGVDLKLKSGVFGAEPWTEEMRAKLEDVLGIDAYDIYGLTEIAGPGVAFECPEKHGMHVNEDHVIIECIDPATGKHQPAGTPGELVFTTITKKGQPAIRYRTHDICTLDDSPCACGRTTIRMGRITGRTDDMLVIRGVNVFPSQIESILVGIKGASPHYLLEVDRINSTDALTVKVEMAPDMAVDAISSIENLRNTIADQIKSVVGIKAKVQLVAPKSIARSEGKAKRVIDNRKL